MINFRLASALWFLLLMALASFAVSSPSTLVRAATIFVSALSIFCAIAIAIGSHGKLRNCAAGFVAISLVFYFGSSYENLPFRAASYYAYSIVVENTDVASPRLSPDGTFVYRTDDGAFFVRRRGEEQYVAVTQQQLKQQKLLNYATSEWTLPTPDHLREILNHLVVLGVSAAGALITGILYDRRTPTADGVAEQRDETKSPSPN